MSVLLVISQAHDTFLPSKFGPSSHKEKKLSWQEHGKALKESGGGRKNLKNMCLYVRKRVPEIEL